MRISHLAVLCLFTSLPALASNFVFTTSAGQTEGASLPVNVTADFNLLNNTTLIVTLDNLETNPTADDQALSDFSFSIAGNLGVTNISSSAHTIYINGQTAGDYSLSTTSSSSGWNTSYTNAATTNISLCDLSQTANNCAGGGGSWPADALIGGPDSNNAYSNANGSITNGAHNPFLSQTVTFTITGTNIPSGATLSSIISDVVFSFGTTSGETAAGTYDPNASGQSVTPEPSAFWLLFAGAGLMAGGAIRKRGLAAR